jgi:hypothetical protein
VASLASPSPLSACQPFYPPYTPQGLTTPTHEVLVRDAATGGGHVVAVPWHLHALYAGPAAANVLGLTDAAWSACFDCSNPLGACTSLLPRLQSLLSTTSATAAAAPATLAAACVPPEAAASTTPLSPQLLAASQLAPFAASTLDSRAALPGLSACSPIGTSVALSTPDGDALDFTAACAPAAGPDTLSLFFNLSARADHLWFDRGNLTLDMRDPDVFEASVDAWSWSGAAGTLALLLRNPSNLTGTLEVLPGGCCT